MAPARTIKIVIIGDSGVGKTSLRGQVRQTSHMCLGVKLSRTTVYLGSVLDRLPRNYWRGLCQ
jgi:guanylate kinase